MGAFDPPFRDIDNTKEGEIYVVDDNGWGWFGLFILAAIPFFIISLMLKGFASAVCNHPVIAAVIYFSIALVIALILYRDKRKKFRLIGVIATILSTLPLAAVQVVYAIPDILTADGFFFMVLSWLLITGLVMGVTYFVISIGNLTGNGLIHLLLSIVFIAVVAMICRPWEDASWEYAKQFYMGF